METKPNETKPESQRHIHTSKQRQKQHIERMGNESKPESGKTTKDPKKHGTFFKIAFEMYRLVEQINEV